ncbi:MAG TPA: GNAT family N-acetyltransferase [Verrucomicrobiae bacterium]
MEWHHGEFRLTDSAAEVDFAAVSALLENTYWARGRAPETARTAFAHSTCFSLFHMDRQMGFCRVVSDFALFSWLADVIIAPEYRGRGLGKWMIRCAMTHPCMQTRTKLLATLDAHGLYEQLGFKRFESLRIGPELKLDPLLS